MNLPTTPRPSWILYEENGSIVPRLENRDASHLPEHDVLIQVHHSSLNYKDALSWSGHKGITREFPHQPGVDAAGTVVASDSPEFLAGQEVIVVGYDLGMNTAGGHGGWIRVPAEWVIPKPEGLSPVECMTLGTAGFTAAQSLYRIQQNGLSTDAGEILVTGASGGVGSVAVSLLAAAGYQVTAATRQEDHVDWLTSLGASAVISTDEVLDDSGKPMLRPRWAGAVETVGGPLLESILRSTQRRAVVTCCGMIGGTAISTNIFPFILRGLTFVGIDSAECPMAMKKEIWGRLATDWKSAHFDVLRETILLENIPERIARMKQGQTRGRVVVTHP